MVHVQDNYAEWAKNCYSDNFSNYLSPLTKQLTGHRCVLCGERAKTTHHAFYTQGGLEDAPGFNLFPVCDKHHGEAHKKPTNWVATSGGDPVTGRYNTAEFYARLQHGWAQYVVESKGEPNEQEFFRPRRDRTQLVVASALQGTEAQNFIVLFFLGVIVLLLAAAFWV